MADDPRQQDRHRAGPDGETAGAGRRTEPTATEGIRPAESTSARATRDSQPPPGAQATPGADGPPPSPLPWSGQGPQAGPPQIVPGQPAYAPWQPPYAPWQTDRWPQTTPWQPGSWGAWQAAPAPVAWPAPYPAAWAPSPGALPIGSVPWGYSNPPAVPPVLEPPGRFHPPAPPRSAVSRSPRRPSRWRRREPPSHRCRPH